MCVAHGARAETFLYKVILFLTFPILLQGHFHLLSRHELKYILKITISHKTVSINNISVHLSWKQTVMYDGLCGGEQLLVLDL